MSTRCQIFVYAQQPSYVLQAGRDYLDAVMMYRHSDGYPDWVLPDICAAYQKAMGPTPLALGRYIWDPFTAHDKELAKKYGGTNNFKLARVGYVAGYICGAMWGMCQPEQGLDLHGDIEYLYVVDLSKVDEYAPIKPWPVRVYENIPKNIKPPFTSLSPTMEGNACTLAKKVSAKKNPTTLLHLRDGRLLRVPSTPFAARKGGRATWANARPTVKVVRF